MSNTARTAPAATLLMAHEARIDFAMLFGTIFLLVVGAGPWSLDVRWSRKSLE